MIYKYLNQVYKLEIPKLKIFNNIFYMIKIFNEI